MAGAPIPCRDHASRMAELAVQMRDDLMATRSELPSPISVRIGIATGPAVAGIIGTSRFSYDVWGQTVNLAARLESHGIPGKILVCSATRALIVEDWQLTQQRRIDLKGIGPVDAWVLDGRRSEMPALIPAPERP